MEVKATLVGVTEDYATGEMQITFSSPQKAQIREFYDKAINGKPLRVKVVKWQDKRSLDANAYFHVLVGKIADVLNLSKAYVKNDMITSYGQLEYEDDKPVVLVSNIPIEKMMEQELLHCKAVGFDADRIEYMVYRGSHTYNTYEMAKLIDGTVQTAKDLDIETLPSDELERLKNLWQEA